MDEGEGILWRFTLFTLGSATLLLRSPHTNFGSY